MMTVPSRDTGEPSGELRRRRRRQVLAGTLVALVAVAVLGPGPIERTRDYFVRSLAMDVGPPTGGEPFDPPSGTPPAVRLAAVGDIGTGDGEEQETADAIAAIPGRYDGLVLLGDFDETAATGITVTANPAPEGASSCPGTRRHGSSA